MMPFAPMYDTFMGYYYFLLAWVALNTLVVLIALIRLKWRIDKVDKKEELKKDETVTLQEYTRPVRRRS